MEHGKNVLFFKCLNIIVFSFSDTSTGDCNCTNPVLHAPPTCLVCTANRYNHPTCKCKSVRELFLPSSVVSSLQFVWLPRRATGMVVATHLETVFVTEIGHFLPVLNACLATMEPPACLPVLAWVAELPAMEMASAVMAFLVLAHACVIRDVLAVIADSVIKLLAM
jgi:hypothetical protein